MLKKQFILLAGFLSFSALAGVSFEEKRNRVEFLEELSKHSTSMDIEAYQRELHYEKLGLSLDERAENEANLLAEEIKQVVIKAYEASMALHGDPQLASQEIQQQIEKDLEAADPSLKEELQKFALDALSDLQKGSIDPNLKLENAESILKPAIQERYQFLNRESVFELSPDMTVSEGGKFDPETKFSTKAQLLASLTSEQTNGAGSPTSSMNLRSEAISSRYANISLHVKIEFLGTGISAGPIISFRRELKTDVFIVGVGLQPILLPDGNFDFIKKDGLGRVIRSNGAVTKRPLYFTCNASLTFGTDYNGSGSFSVVGVGGYASSTKTYNNNVTLTSRLTPVPEFLDQKQVSLTTLRNLCHQDFIKAHITNTMTVESSLDLMMRNVVAGLKFSHPKTQCATDRHCRSWFNHEVIPLMRLKSYPRCVENPREKYFACELRGLEGQNCAVFKNGKRVSDGMWEYVCDKGLACVQTEAGGWFKYAKGKCMPINRATYKAP